MRWAIRIAGVIVGLAVVCFLGLWIASNRRDAGRMRASIEIERAPEEIWPWLNEPEQLTQWVGWLAEVRPDSTTPAEGIGHRATWVMDDPRAKQRILVPGTVTVWDPPDQVGVHVEVPGSFDGDVLYKLTDLGNGRTRVEQDGRFSYDSKFASLMEPLITPDAMRKMFEDMKRLKAKVEGVPDDPDTGDHDEADSTATRADSTAH
jgi:carbon monoxide dehydrogenase subunit G